MRYLYRLRAYLINYVPFLGHGLAALVPLAVAHATERLTFHWLMIPVAVLLGNLPDIDTSYSHLGRLVPRVSKYIEKQIWSIRYCKKNQLPASDHGASTFNGT